MAVTVSLAAGFAVHHANARAAVIPADNCGNIDVVWANAVRPVYDKTSRAIKLQRRLGTHAERTKIIGAHHRLFRAFIAMGRTSNHVPICSAAARRANALLVHAGHVATNADRSLSRAEDANRRHNNHIVDTEIAKLPLYVRALNRLTDQINQALAATKFFVLVPSA
jgi:hypothetical protein